MSDDAPPPAPAPDAARSRSRSTRRHSRARDGVAGGKLAILAKLAAKRSRSLWRGGLHAVDVENASEAGAPRVGQCRNHRLDLHAIDAFSPDSLMSTAQVPDRLPSTTAVLRRPSPERIRGAVAGLRAAAHDAGRVARLGEADARPSLALDPKAAAAPSITAVGARVEPSARDGGLRDPSAYVGRAIMNDSAPGPAA